MITPEKISNLLDMMATDDEFRKDWLRLMQFSSDQNGPDWSRAGFDTLNEPRQPATEGWLQ